MQVEQFGSVIQICQYACAEGDMCQALLNCRCKSYSRIESKQVLTAATGIAPLYAQ